jgi:outer membrane protein assembly factor BamA
MLSLGTQAQQTHPVSSDSLFVIDRIVLKGNKITRSNIILRELEFKTGDTLFRKQLESKLMKSKQNLLNLTLFNFVEIQPQRHEFNKISIQIRVTERWYIWPLPILSYADRNFNVWWKNKDYSRTNFGIDISNNNFRGRRERLDLIVQGGYDKSLLLEWSVPFVNKKMTWGMGIKGGIIFNHETDYALNNNKLLYYTNSLHYVQKYYFAQISIYSRPKFHQSHFFYFSFKQYRFADSLLLLNPTYAYQTPKISYLAFEYNYKLDHRDYAPYPLNGYYFEVDAQKEGLGLLDKEINLFSAKIIFDQYMQLHKKWYFAYNLSFEATNTYKRHFVQEGLGYKPMSLRGYQLYVIKGNAIGILRSNLKYELIPKTKSSIPYIRSEKFSKFFYALYVNLFFDTGYVSNHQDIIPQPLNNRLLYGTGIGLDYVTYYDVVFRLEYTFNREGERAFFVSFVAPI